MSGIPINTFYVVKSQHGKYLSGTRGWRDEICKTCLLTLRTAKARCTRLLNSFDYSGIIPTIVEVTINENATPTIELEFKCDVCGCTDVPIVQTHQIQKQHHWSKTTYTQSVYRAVCRVCGTEKKMGKK